MNKSQFRNPLLKSVSLNADTNEGSETGCLNELVTFLFSPLACLVTS